MCSLLFLSFLSCLSSCMLRERFPSQKSHRASLSKPTAWLSSLATATESEADPMPHGPPPSVEILRVRALLQSFMHFCCQGTSVKRSRKKSGAAQVTPSPIVTGLTKASMQNVMTTPAHGMPAMKSRRSRELVFSIHRTFRNLAGHPKH